MTAPARVGESLLLADHPWVVRQFSVTSGTDAGEITHGGPARKPDLVFGINTSANPTGSDWSMTASSSTSITLDFEDNTNETWLFTCIWFSAGTGGIS
jgi:hypothetical protein